MEIIHTEFDDLIAEIDGKFFNIFPSNDDILIKLGFDDYSQYKTKGWEIGLRYSVVAYAGFMGESYTKGWYRIVSPSTINELYPHLPTMDYEWIAREYFCIKLRILRDVYPEISDRNLMRFTNTELWRDLNGITTFLQETALPNDLYKILVDRSNKLHHIIRHEGHHF